MRFRKLRIAWTVFCALACVLLTVMWVRSYWYLESVLSDYGNVSTVRGTVIVNFFDFVYAWKLEKNRWAVTQNAPWRWSHDAPMRRWPPIRISEPAIGVRRVELEYWFLTSMFVLLGAAVWQSRIHFRFSLRTLLIATTLVAIVLGLVVYAASK